MNNKTFTSINNPEAAMMKAFGTDLEKGGVGSGKKKTLNVGDYQHNRAMSLYHTHHENDLNQDIANKTKNNEDTSVLENIKNGHKEAADEYHKKAKKLYNHKEHGGWSEFKISKDEAFKYGEKFHNNQIKKK